LNSGGMDSLLQEAATQLGVDQNLLLGKLGHGSHTESCKDGHFITRSDPGDGPGNQNPQAGRCPTHRCAGPMLRQCRTTSRHSVNRAACRPDPRACSC
jgi:hypothetical protein